LAKYGVHQLTLDAARQQLIILRLVVMHVRDDCQLHRLLVEASGRSRASDASGVLLARVRSDLLRPIGRAAGEELANACREARHELGVQFGAPFRLAVAAPRPRLRIVQALGFGAPERLFLDQ
jgi:hypothetical protein